METYSQHFRDRGRRSTREFKASLEYTASSSQPELLCLKKKEEIRLSS
jgi:hypothetical protein